MTRLHGTVIAVGGRGLLLLGRSGAGKSDLALRLIDRGAMLVADDQVLVAAAERRVMASPPPALAGLIEVRGVGLVRLPYLPECALTLGLDLGRPAERLPEPQAYAVDGATMPLIGFDPFTASAARRAELALAHFAPRGAPE